MLLMIRIGSHLYRRTAMEGGYMGFGYGFKNSHGKS